MQITKSVLAGFHFPQDTDKPNMGEMLDFTGIAIFHLPELTFRKLWSRH